MSSTYYRYKSKIFKPSKDYCSDWFWNFDDYKTCVQYPLSNIHVAIYDVGSLTISGSIFTYYSEITPLVSSNSSYLKNNPNCLQNWFIAVSVDLGWWLNTIAITNESTQGLFLCIFVFITSSDFRHSCFIFISSIYLHNWICPMLYIVDTIIYSGQCYI